MNVFALISNVSPNLLLPVLLYIGPDVFLPLTSALAAIVGILLLFWQKLVAFIGRVWHAVFHRER